MENNTAMTNPLFKLTIGVYIPLHHLKLPKIIVTKQIGYLVINTRYENSNKQQCDKRKMNTEKKTKQNIKESNELLDKCYLSCISKKIITSKYLKNYKKQKI